MKIIMANGFFPAIVTNKTGRWSHTKGPLIKASVYADAPTMAHEEAHVAQWYLFWVPTFILCIIAGSLVALFAPVLSAYAPPAFIQFAAMMPVILVSYLTWNSHDLRWRRETAAYAATCRTQGSLELAHFYANILVTNTEHYNFRYTVEESAAQIRKRYIDEELF